MAHLLYFAPKDCFMSYNYLPLDHNQLHFQQIKDLLEYNQLVSITYSAHENILRHIQQQRPIMQSAVQTALVQPIDHYFELNTTESSQLIPSEIVKLMLMLKIKSLSCGKYFVEIATLIRLMDMFNQNLLPMVYTQNETDNKNAALCHLLMPLLGLGKVYYQEKITDTAEIMNAFQWQPIPLKQNEYLQMLHGDEYICAYGIYCLIKLESILKKIDWVSTQLPAFIAQIYMEAQQIFHQTLQLFMEEINAPSKNVNQELFIQLNKCTNSICQLTHTLVEKKQFNPINTRFDSAPKCLAQIEIATQISDAFFIPYLRKN